MGLWFEACCKLVRHARENHGEVLPISVIELPYNHSFFEQYSEKGRSRFSPERPTRVSLSEGSPIILRPEQIVTTQATSQLLQWTICLAGQRTDHSSLREIYHRRSGEFTSEVISHPDTDHPGDGLHIFK